MNTPTTPNPSAGGEDELDRAIDAILDAVQDYTVESALGGDPFKSEEENKAYLQKTYDEGRTQAHRQLRRLILLERKAEFNGWFGKYLANKPSGDFTITFTRDVILERQDSLDKQLHSLDQTGEGES